MNKIIPFSPPDIGSAEIAQVCEVLQSGWITTGPKVKKLEDRISEYCHTGKTVCLNSATAAAEMNFRVTGIGEGDEVIVPAYTYTATASSALHVGARIKMVDCTADSPEIDYNKLADTITERTKAIVPVDLAGVICDYDKIYQILEAKRHLFRPANPIQESIGRVIVCADCAHAFGAVRKGKMAGEIADFSSFSFHAVKNLTTAEGGASTWRQLDGIDNEELYHRYQLLSLHGQSKDALDKTKLGAWEYDILGPWYKCNMTDIMGALGLAQFERYPSLLARRRELIKRYDRAMDALGIWHLRHSGPDFQSSGHLYMVRIPGATLERRNDIIRKMGERGVACNVHYKPLPMMTAYRALGFDIQDFPNAFHFFENEITFPLHTCLSDTDVDYVNEIFNSVFKEHIS